MLNGKTVIVLGAGSSKSFGLPVGSELIEQIHNISKVRFEHNQPSKESNDPKFAHTLSYLHNKLGVNLDSVNSFRRTLEAALSAKSIDDFIYFENDENLSIYSKIAISYSIISTEYKSSIYRLNDPNRPRSFDERFKGNWMERLFNLIIKGTNKRSLDKLFQDVVFINFNYDRCVEHYLLISLCIIYQVDEHKAWDIVSRIKIIRPYGYIGAIRGG